MKHIFLAVLLVSFALPNAVSFAQDDAEARAARVQQQNARRNAAIERMISPSTRARVQQQQQGAPRVERPRQIDATPRVNPRPRAERTFTPSTPPAANQPAAGVQPRRNRSGDRSGRGDWRNRGGVGENTVVARPDAGNRGDGVRGRNWRGRDGGDNTTGDWRNRRGDGNNEWRNRTGGDRDWRNRSGRNRHWDRGDRSNRHRHWNRTRHDRSWWRNNYNRFVLFGGGYYYLHNNYWYPAYGYDPYFTTYVYDAPLYAYNGLSPQQVIAEVQAELQRQGYYRGGVDGSFGPMTRRALVRYQEDSGLPVTGQIDEETLVSLGFE